MSDKEVTSDDDSDYNPEGENGNVSEELESGDAESDTDDLKAGPAKKRRRGLEPDDNVKEVAKPQVSSLDVDAIWADFNKESNDTSTKQKVDLPPPLPSSTSEKPAAVPIVKPQLPTPKAAGGGGLSSLLGQLGKKNKLSTLEKSKQDWLNFKRDEGIEEDLRSHNKGKDGFLERRDFLERTDHRQFELEKQLRAIKRSSR